MFAAGEGNAAMTALLLAAGADPELTRWEVRRLLAAVKRCYSTHQESLVTCQLGVRSLLVPVVLRTEAAAAQCSAGQLLR